MKNTMQLPAPPDTVNVYDELYKALEKCNKLSPLDSVTYKKVYRAIERHSQLKSGGSSTQNSFLSHMNTELHPIETSRRMLFITNKIGFAIIFHDSVKSPITDLSGHVKYRNTKDLRARCTPHYQFLSI